MIYGTITCICNEELKVESQSPIQCENCERVYDDTGALIKGNTE